MKICEDCIKQDVCKWKPVVEEWEESKKEELPCPLLPTTMCKFKRTRPSNCTYTAPWIYPTADSDDCTLMDCTATGALIGGFN